MAATVTVSVVSNRIPSIQRQLPQLVDRALRAAANQGHQYTVDSMRNSPTTGQVYERGSRTHTASSPGNPPRPDTGALIASLAWGPAGRNKYAITAGVEHAFWMEYGNNRAVEPRPFFGPMAVWLSGQIPNIFEQQMSRV